MAPLGSDEMLFANKLYRLWFGAQTDGPGHGAGALDEVVVAQADTGGADANQDLAGSGVVQLEVDDPPEL